MFLTDLYLRAARRGFENGFTSIFQIVAHRPQGAAKPTPPSHGREPGGGTSELPVPYSPGPDQSQR